MSDYLFDFDLPALLDKGIRTARAAKKQAKTTNYD